MLRPLAVIMAAIYLSRPEMPLEEAERYASVLREEARQHSFDPLSVVAIVHFESGWLPHVVSANGEDFGLGQVRARFIGACRQDADPLHKPSEACREQKQVLLQGEANVRWIATMIQRNRDLCRKKTGTAWFPQWLASYQGLNFPAQKRWCQPREKTHQVIRYHAELKRELLGKGGQLKAEHQKRLEERRRAEQ